MKPRYWMFSLLVPYAVFACWAVARSAPPNTHPCRDGLVEWLNAGDVTACYGHLVAPETFAVMQLAVDENMGLKAKAAALEQQVADLRVELAQARASGDAQLKVCENTRTACELAKTPSKCAKPGLGERPEFSWPTGLGLGFLGGVAFDRWAVGCR